MCTSQLTLKAIAIVEDDPAIMDALVLLFKRQHMEVTCYTDGISLIENDFELPDIFLIDKQLSGIDGLDICRHLKENTITKHIPVIVISASPHVEGMALLAGADEFLEKPFSNKVLLNIIQKHLVQKGPQPEI